MKKCDGKVAIPDVVITAVGTKVRGGARKEARAACAHSPSCPASVRGVPADGADCWNSATRRRQENCLMWAKRHPVAVVPGEAPGRRGAWTQLGSEQLVFPRVSPPRCAFRVSPPRRAFRCGTWTRRAGAAPRRASSGSRTPTGRCRWTRAGTWTWCVRGQQGAALIGSAQLCVLLQIA